MLKGYCLRKDNKLNFALLDKFQHGGIFFSIYLNVWGLPKHNNSTFKKNEIILSYILVICNLGLYFVFN